MQNNFLFRQSWTQYLRLLFVLLGVGLFVSGVISVIAANWEMLSKFQKLYITQGVFLFVSVLSLFFYWRESRRVQTKFKTHVTFFVALILIGALFALIGQIYQTGADPWQLFALWSVLQLPLLLIFPNIASSLLFIATTNLAVGLYGRFYDVEVQFAFLCILNSILLCFSDFVWKKLNDAWRIQPRILNIGIAVSLLIIAIANIQFIFLTWLICGGLVYYYKKYCNDFVILCIHFVALVISVNILLATQGNFESEIVALMAIFTLFSVGIGAWLLNDWHKQAYPNRQLPALINIMLLGLIFLGVMLLIGFILLSFQSEIGLIIVGIACLVGGYLGSQNKTDKSQYFNEMLIVCGLLLCYVYFRIFAIEQSINSRSLILIILPLCFWIYYKIQSNWLRFFSGLLALWVILDYAHYFDFGIFVNAHDNQNRFLWLLWGLIPYIFSFTTLGLGYYFTHKPQSAVSFRPVFWALALFSFCLTSRDYINGIGGGEMAQELPQIASLGQLIKLISGHFFTLENINLVWFCHLMLALSPAIIYLLQRKSAAFNPLHFVVLILFAGCFIASQNILFCFSLLLLAYPLKNHRLFILAVAAMIVSLGLYYYWLGLHFLYKSILLICTGLIFLFVLIFNRKGNRVKQENSGKMTALFDRTVWGLCATVLFTLGIANYSVIKNEKVLNHGIPFILKLAPVDPRSLMQGDYMALNYEILNAIPAALAPFKRDTYDSYELTQTHFYILLKQNAENVAEFCRLEGKIPTDFLGCTPEIYLPLNAVNSWKVTIPGQSYFFPEGKGEYYARAKYGEYRFKDGTVLLYRLLDEQKNPL